MATIKKIELYGTEYEVEDAKIRDASTKSITLSAENNATTSGQFGIAIGAKAEGGTEGAIAIGHDAKALGESANTIAIGANSQVKGRGAIAIGESAIATNPQDSAPVDHAVAIGKGAKAYKEQSMALGCEAQATAPDAIALGPNAQATAENAIAIGSKITGNDTHSVKAAGESSIAIGKGARAIQKNATAIGRNSLASYKSIALGDAANAGYKDSNNQWPCAIAIGGAAIAHGQGSIAIGSKPVKTMTNDDGTTDYDYIQTHASPAALGLHSIAIGTGACATGDFSTMIAPLAHSDANTPTSDNLTSTQAEGIGSVVIGSICHAGPGARHATVVGYRNAANATGQPGSISTGQFVAGKLAKNSNASTDLLFILGNGIINKEGVREPDNALTIDVNGNANLAGTLNQKGADYAEYFEWEDGNPKAEDRIGYVVSLRKDKISKANPGDRVLGVISGTAAVIGDTAAMRWQQQYLTDDFGRILYDKVEEFDSYIDENGNVVRYSLGVYNHPRINPAYNPDEDYIPREKRPEWGCVGLVGKLYVRDDGTCVPGEFAKVGANGVLTYSAEETNMQVMKRTKENIVYVLKL